MNRPLRALLMVAAIAAVFSVSQPASAQYGFGHYPFAAAHGFYPNYYVDQRPPYFAQFPPVYYKDPIIARQYGQSPFPYPACGCGSSAAAETVKPTTIRNPYVQPSDEEASDLKEASTAKEASSGPLLIRNPYVNTPDKNASTDRVRSAQTIYPAATFASRR